MTKVLRYAGNRCMHKNHSILKLPIGDISKRESSIAGNISIPLQMDANM